MDEVKFETKEVSGIYPAMVGMRNPKNSWHLNDTITGMGYGDKIEAVAAEMAKKYMKQSLYEGFSALDYESMLIDNGILKEHDGIIEYCFVGPRDMKLAQTLVKGGDPHCKFMRQIQVIVDITMPAYWWAEFDTYKVGTVRDSCSIQHKGTARDWTLSDFTIDNLVIHYGTLEDQLNASTEEVNNAQIWNVIIKQINYLGHRFNETKDYRYFRAMRQMMPMGVKYKATVSLNYAVLRAMYTWRKNHSLSEWSVDCMDWIKTLPYAKQLITIE